MFCGYMHVTCMLHAFILNIALFYWMWYIYAHIRYVLHTFFLTYDFYDLKKLNHIIANVNHFQKCPLKC